MHTQKYMRTNTQNEMQTYKHGSSVQVGSRDISKHEAANDATDGDKFWCSWPGLGQGHAFKSKHMNKQEKFSMHWHYQVSQLKSWEVEILDSWFLATLTQRPHAADKFGRRSSQTTNGQRNVCSDLQVNNWNSIQLSVLLSTTTRVEKKPYISGQILWGGWVLLGICLK